MQRYGNYFEIDTRKASKKCDTCVMENDTYLCFTACFTQSNSLIAICKKISHEQLTNYEQNQISVHQKLSLIIVNQHIHA